MQRFSRPSDFFERHFGAIGDVQQGVHPIG
jgi:hypothetical protein